MLPLVEVSFTGDVMESKGMLSPFSSATVAGKHRRGDRGDAPFRSWFILVETGDDAAGGATVLPRMPPLGFKSGMSNDRAST
mmetsp:Transcript_67442/g.78275  ORF Transcript_67442/g.78275 Transcript_67442/m.78275 type:complete len:82 (+) Transcript_67442:318-563(+)